MSFRRLSGAGSARGSRSFWRISQAIESLESRRLLTAVAWDGGGDGVNWSDAANWSTDAVPTSADDVTIDVVSNPTITVRGSRFVRTLTNAETVRVLSDNTVGTSQLTIGVSASNSGTLALEAADSNWSAFLNIADGATFTNAGTIEARTGTGGRREVTLGSGGVAAATLVNNGTITVQAGTPFEVNGTGGSLDLMTQNGAITIAAGGKATLGLLRLNYVGGSNSSGLFVRNGTQLDLDAASAPSVVAAVGAGNILLGHDAANLTLQVRGDNDFGGATLNVPASVNNSGIIELTSFDSTWPAAINLADGVTLTNSGTLRATPGAGGQRFVSLGNGGAMASSLINNGTINVTGAFALDLNGTGGSLDTFQQNGQILIAAGGRVATGLVLFKYIGGSNQPGLIGRGGTQFDLDAAAAASTIASVGAGNVLLGHDAPNLTLRVQGDDTFGHATLQLSSSIATTGIIELQSNDSTWASSIQLADGVTLTNNGTLRARQGSGGQRIVSLGNGGIAAAGFINNGTVDVGSGTSLRIDGSGGSLDLFRQNGSVTIAAGASVVAGSVLLNYTGGSNQAGLYVYASQIDSDAIAAPSTVYAAASNILIDHSAVGLTIQVQGADIFGSATLNVPVNATSASTILFQSTDSTWSSSMQVADGATFTNTGTLRSMVGSGGPRFVGLGTGGVAPAGLVNSGTIDVGTGAILEIVGSGGSLDVVSQSGQINIAAGGKVTVGSTRFNYLNGTNQPGLIIYSSQIDLANAAAATTVIASGTNTLLGIADADFTLVAQGNGTYGSSNLAAANGAVNSGVIELDAIDSSWGARLMVGDGATFTNAGGGEIRIRPGTFGGPRSFDISTTLANPGALNNAGTIRIIGNPNVDGSGRVNNTGLIIKPDANESVFSPTLFNTGAGLVNIQAGTLRFVSTNIGDPAGTFLSGGRYRVADGARLGLGFSFFSQPTINTADIEVTGSGVVEFDALQVNRGRIALLDGADLTISPFPPFTLEGIFDLSSTSVLTINSPVVLGGTSQPIVRSELASATNFGRLVINGTLNLNSPASTSRFDPDLVGAYDPPIGARHDVIVATGGITNGFDSFQGGLTPSGRVLLATRPDAQTVAVEIGPGPLPPPPQVLSQTFEYETRQAITFQFDQNVSAFLSRKDLQLQNLTLNTTIPNAVGTLSYNQPSNQATLVFTNEVPDGNYRLTINASDIANSAGVPSSGAPITLDFFILSADANRDRAVNLDDFTALAANFGVPNRVFSEGDFNYDTNVNLDDFTILASQFGKTLPASLFRAHPIVEQSLATARMIELVASTSLKTPDLFGETLVAELPPRA